jgi:hypothetical protein
MQQHQKRSMTLRVAALALVMALSLMDVAAWSPNQKAFGSRRKRHSIATKPSNPVTFPQSPTRTSQNMLKNPGNPRVKSQSPRESKVKLSNSVLASCDTLPSFPTAHGLLSPETVMRLEAMNRGTLHNEALVNFLSTYRKSGPLSCVPMLSDPDVLPHLTRAMRDITL